MTYRNPAYRLTLSPRLERVKAAILPRLKPNRLREDTCTCPVPTDPTLNPFAEVFLAHPDAPYVINLANAIVRSWEVSPCVIFPDEIIVGITRPVYASCEHFSWGIRNADAVLHDSRLGLSPTEAEALWRRMEPMTGAHMGEVGEKLLGKERFHALCAVDPLFAAGGYQGHTVPNYATLLDNGLDGMLALIDRYAAQNACDDATRDFYEANRTIIRGMSAWLERYVTEATRLAEQTDGDARDTYRAIAENCTRVAHQKPATLYEAAQLIWCLSLWDWVDCMGRMDQYLYPYYERSVAEGDAFPVEDVVVSLIFKLWENGAHNITLGGVRPDDGSDATNDLTYLFLQVLRNIHDTHPRMSVRVHKDSPRELLDLAVAIWAEGMSDPSVVSDETVIPGLIEVGIPVTDARDYTMLGCQEIEIPGKSNWGCEDGLFNVAKALEYTLWGGRNPRCPEVQVGPATGNFTDFETFEDLFAAFATQLAYLTDVFCQLCDAGQEIRAANFAKLVKTPFTTGCMERGKPHDAGGPLYNLGVVETAGVAVAADALTAIQKLVFDERLMTKETLMAALAANFEGYEREQQMLLNRAPKFGNDDPKADAMAVRVLNLFWDECRKHRSIRGDVYVGACSLLESGITFGHWTGALPDGRLAGEPLGNSIGPRPGADKSGLTAMLNSVAKLPLRKGVGGTTLNVLLPTRDLTDATSRDAITAALRTYLLNGGQMAQITTANVEELRDAQRCPERHENLIVRIGGFSIQFVQLGREAQDEIISRYGA